MIKMTDATDEGYGSEGFCPHCKHQNYCIGSTNDKGSSRQYKCHGSDTYLSSCSPSYIQPLTIKFGYSFEIIEGISKNGSKQEKD